jgi:hypothetical protein
MLLLGSLIATLAKEHPVALTLIRISLDASTKSAPIQSTQEDLIDRLLRSKTVATDF